jgi:hypothetical protein
MNGTGQWPIGNGLDTKKGAAFPESGADTKAANKKRRPKPAETSQKPTKVPDFSSSVFTQDNQPTLRNTNNSAVQAAHAKRKPIKHLLHTYNKPASRRIT